MAHRFNINGVAFDTTAAPTPLVSGYDKVARDALSGDTLIKVRTAAVKSNFPSKLTKGLQVTTYNPNEMKDKNNFFNFVSSWETHVLVMETHIATFHMQSSFTLYVRREVPPTAAQTEAFQRDLMMFLLESNKYGGDANQYEEFHPAVIGHPAIPPVARIPGVGGAPPVPGHPGYPEVIARAEIRITHHRPTPPPSAITIVEGGNILRDWHSMTLQQVVDSARLQIDFVDDVVHRQNLSWTFEYFLNGIDSDLKAYVLSKISSLDVDVGRTGPVIFMIIAKRLLHTTENLAQKVINGLINLRLTHFDGENLTDCIFTLRNVLKFLRYGEANSFAPRTTITLLYDVFRGSTVSSFRNYVQQAQDIVLVNNQDPEEIFDHLQLKYEELLLADRWVPMKKKGSAFAMGEPELKSYADHEKSAKAKNTTSTDDGYIKDSKGKSRRSHDKSGRKIDYTPPKNNESSKREVDGRDEFWCEKCGRWGSHSTSDHDDWKGRLNAQNARNRSSANVAETTTSGSVNEESSQIRHSVTFAQATRQGLSLAVDKELMDGIDL